ncbi:uncharacterized protein ISCGN_015027 [Ixodes scapularis]
MEEHPSMHLYATFKTNIVAVRWCGNTLGSRLLAEARGGALRTRIYRHRSNGPANLKPSTGPKKQASPKAAVTKVKQAVQKNTVTSTPTPPSTDPEICELKKNGSDFALPSLQCTLKNLPKEIAKKWKDHMTLQSKDESGLLQEICEAKERNEDPDFMKAYSPDDKGMDDLKDDLWKNVKAVRSFEEGVSAKECEIVS